MTATARAESSKAVSGVLNTTTQVGEVKRELPAAAWRSPVLTLAVSSIRLPAACRKLTDFADLRVRNSLTTGCSTFLTSSDSRVA